MKKPAVAVIATLVVLGAAGALWYYDYSVGFGAPAKADFTGYYPQVMPPGVKITHQKLTRVKEAYLDYWWFRYDLQVNTKDFFMFEKKNEYADGPVSCKTSGDPCREFTTSKGLTYIVVVPEYEGKPFSVSVEWYAGQTEFKLLVDEAAAQKYASYDWMPMMSSLVPVDLTKMKYDKEIHYQGGG